MKKLFSFELKRLVKSNSLLLGIALTVIIGILGMVLNYIYFGNQGTPKECMISIYNSYTQFTYLIVGFLFVQTFAKDYSKGVVNFYLQMGYSVYKQNMCKMLVLLSVFIPIIDVFVLICNIIYGNKDIKFMLLLIVVIDLATFFIILISMLVALMNKKVVNSVLVFYGLFLLLNVINLMMYGFFDPADANSISTYLLSECAGRRMSHYSLDNIREKILPYKAIISILSSLICCGVLFIVNSIILKKRNNSIVGK